LGNWSVTTIKTGCLHHRNIKSVSCLTETCLNRNYVRITWYFVHCLLRLFGYKMNCLAACFWDPWPNSAEVMQKQQCIHFLSHKILHQQTYSQ
jgi:hypothetical protein